MKPYNVEMVPYAAWRVIVLAWVGKLLGIKFHVGDFPFGSCRPAPKVWVPYRGYEWRA